MLLGALASLAGVLLYSQALAHGMSDADKQRILDAGLLEYAQLGAKHMVTGYDHLLFLFGVIFFLTRFMDILKFVTAFTIGHSITLIVATFAGIQANYYLIDAVIALTVCYKPFENLDGFKRYLNSGSPNLTWMVFAFGLIHGFGLSTRLQQLPLGESGLLLKIISFNVGVELGQVIALALMLVLLSTWRRHRSFVQFSTASNVALMAVGGLLLLVQLHGFQHTAYTDDFPLNRDDHYHAHAENAADDGAAGFKGYERKGIFANPDIKLPDASNGAPQESGMHRHGEGPLHAH